VLRYNSLKPSSVCIELGLASGFGSLMIVLGGLTMAISFGTVSACLAIVSQGYGYLCWNPIPWNNRYALGAFGFFAGTVVASLGAIFLVGPSLVRFLGRLGGSGSDPE